MIKRVNDDMRNVEEIRIKANNYMAGDLPRPYQGETRVLHFLEVLRDEIGFDELKEKVVQSTGREEDRRLLRVSASSPGKDPGL